MDSEIKTRSNTSKSLHPDPVSRVLKYDSAQKPNSSKSPARTGNKSKLPMYAYLLLL